MPSPSRRAIALLLGTLAGCHRPYVVPPGSAPQTIIMNVSVIDGLGGERRRANVLIDGDRISAVGRLRPGIGDRVIDGRGLVLAPGLIDIRRGIRGGRLSPRNALDAVRQGITTIVVGGGGESVHPLRPLLDSLRRSPAYVNVASYAGHQSLRAAVLAAGNERVATPAESAQLTLALSEDLGAGALGFSSALETDTAGGASVPEWAYLARLTADSAGRVSGAVDRGSAPLGAIEDFIRIARDSRIPAQIALWPRGDGLAADGGDSLTAIIDRARASGAQVTTAVCLSRQSVLPKIAESRYAVLCSGEGQSTEQPPDAPSFLHRLARIAGERTAPSFETLVRKSTALAASTFGLEDRGAILPGRHADLILFDEGMLHSAMAGSSSAPPGGIRAVWVNGVVVYRNGEATGARPGRVLTRGGVSPDR